MNPWQVLILAAYSVVVLVTLVRHFILTAVKRHMTFLSPTSPRMTGPNLPLVSILVPAKDEEHGIESCVRSLLAQNYPHFEVLVIDDRSADRTAEIVERIAEHDVRLQLVRVRELPPGWTGKTHALDVGQRKARGSWLLFVDADTRHEPQTLSALLRDAVDHGAHLESMLPALDARTFWEATVQPFAGVCLMVFFPLHKVNDARLPEFAFANGQFILIRRDAYDAIGGHEAVRDKFVEDIHLGRNVRRHGLGLRVVMAPALSRVRMYSSLSAIIRGWSRILYSSVDHRPAKLYALLAAICVFSVLSYAVLIGTGCALIAGAGSPFVVWLLGLGAAHQVFQTTIMARIYDLSHSRKVFLLARILAVAVMLIVVVKTIRMCRTHRIVWRGTTYGREIQQPAG